MNFVHRFFSPRSSANNSLPKTQKIVNDEAIFVRYAVAESAAYLGVCEHLRRK